MSIEEKPLLFHYPASIYSHRVLWYLWLRGIAYDECIQPPYMPRPDLSSLNVNYRRIPVLAIGKDIYCDSRLIIQTLESKYSGSTLTPPSAADNGVRRLLENFTIDGGVFWNAVKLIPYWKATGLLQDEKFVEDRASLRGGVRMTAEMMEAGRPEGLQHIRQAFEIMETTFLADGRKWILGTEGPTTADIDGVWPFEWLVKDPAMQESLPEEFASANKYPRTFAWVNRLMDAVAEGKAKAQKPTRYADKELEEKVRTSNVEFAPTTIISDDPLKLQGGEEVEVYASDYGFTHKDRGILVGLTLTEVVIRNSKNYHLHFPRWNFRIAKVAQTPSSSLKPSKKIPNMRLIYHHASPYTQKVFMVALEHNLESHITLEKVVVCPIPYPGWSDNNADVAVYNPMAKIPCLVPEDVADGIFDSRIICEYFEHIADIRRKKDAKYFQLRTLHACADGIMDAAVLIIYEERIREARGIKFDEWVQGQKLKMLRGLDRFGVAIDAGILGEPPTKEPASIDAIAVVTAVSTMDQVGIEWREGRGKLLAWFEKWKQRRSFQLAPPDKEWKAGWDVKASSKM